jgi:hypothetical protein
MAWSTIESFHTEPSRRITAGVSIFLIAIGATVLAGWAADLAVLKGLSGAITMKANAAMGILASGLALRWHGSTRPWAPMAGRLCATIAGVLGALTLTEHIVGWNLGIARQFVERHGGTIQAQSEGVGRGAVFTIRLPLADRLRHGRESL